MTDQRGSRVKLHAMRDVQASTSRGLVGSKQRLLASQHNNLPMTADAQMLLKVLGKRPDMRTVEGIENRTGVFTLEIKTNVVEIDNLFEWVLKNGSTNKLFSGIQDVICKTICREMTLYTAPPNSVICYQGDFGDVFYIIISGQVALYVDENEKKQAKPFEDDVKLLLQRALLDDNIASSAANNVSASTRHLHSDAAHQLKQFGKFIRFIGSGGTFGELAVMEPTAQRTCTVVSTTVTSFICLKRAAYQRLVRASNGDTVGFTQYEFLDDLFYFESWSHGDVQRFSNKLRQSFLLRHGNEANVMYFIYSGIVQESMPMVCLMDEHGVAIKYTPVEEKNKKGAAKGPSANVGAPTSTLLADTTSVPDSAGHGIPLSELKRKRVSVEIALYEEHDICGAAETAPCTSDSQDNDLLGEHALLYNQSHSKVDLRASKATPLARDPRCTKVIAAREKANIRKKRKGKTDKQKAEEFAQERRRVLRGNKPILHKPDKDEDAKASLKMRFRVAATAVPDEVRKKAEAVTRPPTRPRSPHTKPRVARASYEPEDDGPEEVHGMAAIAPIPLAMQNSLAKDNVAAEFRLNLLQRLKTVQTVEAYQATRTDVLAAMSTPDGTTAKPTGKDSRRPRRPKVPKNRRHRRGPQSTRLYRRVDRMLKKLWPAEYSLPQVEDSLKDVKIRHD
ncbi:hypothetical protein DYB32_000906 [Aphanomyces invadans]|uniref:Cyclic nucleotide-binding domain-containing protein n=1 Tax=Aphanomyces invadans TaxID=157072 RepID=A0A418B8I0_9STRA|nr:hypothetical protein DYB32_000906 [Aphanomyces invadans]